MKTVILAAGSGTRMKPLTETQSKPMIPVANKPALEWLVDAVEAVSEDIFIVIRKDQKDIINHFSSFPKIKFVYQEKPLGTADALKTCKEFLKDYEGQILKLNGDDLISREDIFGISRLTGNYAGVVYSHHPERFGVVNTKNDFVENIEEKPEKPKSNLISPGVFLFDKKIFDYIEKTPLSKRNEYEITDTINMMAKEEKIKIFEIKKWITISYPWQLLDANKLVLDEIGTQIGKNVEIRPGTHIEYPVAIGDGTVLGPNCFIRRYSTIGKNCKVGNAVEIKNSIIMDNSYVSHLSYVGDSVIGKNCNIGAGSIFANLRLDDNNINTKIKDEKVDTERRKLGGVIGDGVKLGVNVTIMPGKKIWPKIMVPPCCMIIHDIQEQPDMKTFHTTHTKI